MTLPTDEPKDYAIGVAPLPDILQENLPTEPQYYDNTRLVDFKECPRKYYLRHIRGWRGKGTAMPLVFGLSWHDAMDYLWSRYNQESESELLVGAAKAFHERWISEGLKPAGELNIDDIERLGARTPMVAAEMMYHYLQSRKKIFDRADFQLEAVEQPFAVPIFPNRPNVWYIGRLDKVFNYNGSRIVGEHKTTSEYKKEGGFKQQYLESWSPNSQIEGYMYAANLYFPGGARQVWLDASLVHKKEHEFFKFIPISASMAGLDEWLYDTRHWINRVEQESRTLQELVSAASDPALWAFPRNTNSCSGKYGMCTYVEVCRNVRNPAQLIEPPEGFIEDRWMPFDVLQIGKLGLPPEEVSKNNG